MLNEPLLRATKTVRIATTAVDFEGAKAQQLGLAVDAAVATVGANDCIHNTAKVSQ